MAYTFASLLSYPIQTSFFYSYLASSQMEQRVCVASFVCFYFVQKIHLKFCIICPSPTSLLLINCNRCSLPSHIGSSEMTQCVSVYFLTVCFCCLFTGNKKVLCCNSSSYIAILPLPHLRWHDVFVFFFARA